MTSNSYPREALPAEAERREILERAGAILKQAQVLCETLDQTQGRLLWLAENRRADLDVIALQRSDHRTLKSDSISRAA